MVFVGYWLALGMCRGEETWHWERLVMHSGVTQFMIGRLFRNVGFCTCSPTFLLIVPLKLEAPPSRGKAGLTMKEKVL